MLKKTAFGYSVLLTAFRIVLLVLSWNRGTTVLPVTIYVLNGMMVLFGLYLIIKRIVRKTHLRELLVFFILDLVVVIFNLLYVNWQVPLQLSVVEMLLCGSVPQALLDIVFAFYCFKNIRNQYRFLVKMVKEGTPNDKTNRV